MKYFIAVLTFIALLSVTTANAQNDTTKHLPTYKVGIFAPLYLDSVFNNNTFRYSKAVPRFIMPAVDFIQGAQIAFDSIPAGNENIEAFIFDSKAYKENIAWLIQNKKLDSLNLIIGNVKDIEYKQLSEFTLQKKIPFVSATLPNDGGITAHPYLVILNSTLKAHCDAIYSYLLQNHGTDKIFLCRQPGTQEDMVASFFKQSNEQDGRPLLDMQTLNFEEPLNIDYLKSKLDSNRQNIIIGGSLDEIFAGNISTACFKLYKTYPLTLFGMPNWDAMPVLHKKDALKDFPIYFTSPYFNNKWDNYSKMVVNGYAKKYKTKPSDMAFKGFESVALFTQLLKKYPNNLMNNLNDKTVNVICEYNFRPVMLKKENLPSGQAGESPDYFENKHLYFIKLLNGTISKAW